MNSPRLLFLDEPSTGMDPHNRANLWEHIRRLRAELGTTIVLTTHYLEEADAEAERVIVIDHGKIIADDTAPHLKATLAGDLVTVVVDPADAERAAVVLGERGSGRGATDPEAPRCSVTCPLRPRPATRCRDCCARSRPTGCSPTRPTSKCRPWTTSSCP